MSNLPKPHYPRYRWVIILFLWLHGEFAQLGSSALGIILPAMRADLGFGPLEAGWLGAARAAGTILLLIPASVALTRYSPRWVYALLLLLAGAGLVVVSTAQSFWSLYGIFLVYVSMVAITQVPIALIRLQWVRVEEFATVMGVGQSMNASGQSATMILIPWLLLWLGGWRPLFVGLGGVILGMGLLWMLLGRDRTVPPRGSSRRVDLGSLKEVLRRREFVLIGLCMFGASAGWSTTILFLPTHLLDSRGLDLTTVGIVMGVMPLGGLVAAVASGFASDRIGRRKPLIWPVGLLAPPAWLALLLPLPLPLLLAAAVVTGFVAWAPWPAMTTMVFEVRDVTPAQVAMGQSFTQTLQMVGSLLGPVLAGAIAQAVGSFGPGLAVMSLLPGLVGIFGLMLPERKVGEDTSRPLKGTTMRAG